MPPLLKLLRPHQYTKNLFVFAPAFFAIKFIEPTVLWHSALAFVAFCAMASSIYILNDHLDRDADRKHPEKCKRPIASGQVTIRQAASLFIFLILLSLGIGFSNNLATGCVLIAYFILNVSYCIKLKHLYIVDMICVATGFVLRLLAGACATQTPLSQWIVIMVFLLALFLILAKRRDDVLLFQESAIKTRAVIEHYSLPFIDACLGFISAVMFFCYLMYTVSPHVLRMAHSHYFYITSLFVLMGILRYMHITLHEQRSGSPSKILTKDRFIQLTILAWILSFAGVLY